MAGAGWAAPRQRSLLRQAIIGYLDWLAFCCVASRPDMALGVVHCWAGGGLPTQCLQLQCSLTSARRVIEQCTLPIPTVPRSVMALPRNLVAAC